MHLRPIVLSAVFSAGLAIIAGSASAQRYTAETAPIETADIGRFWEAWDRLPAARSYQDTLQTLFQGYYLPGTEGLYDFVRSRIGSVIQLVDQIRSHPRYYASIRTPTLEIRGFEPAIRQALRKWAILSPDARFPGVYFLIGRMTSGGTTAQDRILIGAEMYGRTPETPMEELGDWHRQVLAPNVNLPVIVAHELIHTQQATVADRRLLARVIVEGSADFLGELISGGNINSHVHQWAEPRATQLWRDFQRVMQGNDNAGWLYTRRADGEPNDLGYWMGYRITKAYYDRARDEAQAIQDILHIQDFDAFLAASGIARELGGS